MDNNSNKTNNYQTKDSSSNTINTHTKGLYNNFSNAFFSIFNQSNIILFVLFLAIYFILYYVLGIFVKSNDNPINSQLALSRSIDFLILGIVFLILVSSYYSLQSNDKQSLVSDILLWTKNFYNDPTTPFSLLITILFFYIIVYLIRIPMTSETKPISISFIENKLWVVLLSVIIVEFFKYVLNISIIDLIYGGSNELISNWNSLPKDIPSTIIHDISAVATNPPSSSPPPPPQPKSEVFNITNNLYTYDDAQAVCKAYGARLATYTEIEDSYNSGGEWCNYGWSDGQMILFPTQKSTWDNLQKSDKHKNDCGRPGINGGYIDNPYMQFGINCYGVKPPISIEEKNIMNANKLQVFPKTEEDQMMESKIEYWKKNADKMLLINSFNKDKWTEY